MNKQIVLITGGKGLIGKELTKQLNSNNYEVRILTRNPEAKNEYFWDPIKGEIDSKSLINVDVIIHLAGAGIADKRWTKSRKKEILESRTLGAKLLYNEAIKHKTELKYFVSASGINYYGTKTTNNIFEENDPFGTDFVAKVTVEWEKQADLFKEICPVSKLRIGMVLSKNGGALSKIDKPIKYRVGAVLGNGKQFIPWIELEDLTRMFLFSIENNLKGSFNAVGTSHITNKDLTLKIASRLNRKIWLPKVPGFVLKLILGELAVLVLEGSRASNKKIKQAGFQFNNSDIDTALDKIYISS